MLSKNKEIFFEDVHRASENHPYLNFFSRNLNYISHFHEEIEVIYVYSGNVEVTTQNGTYTLNTGDICIFMPGDIHSFSSKISNHLYVMKLIAYDKSESFDFTQMKLLTNVISSDNPLKEAIFEIIKNVRDEYLKKSTGYEYAINMYINKLIMFIIRRLTFETKPAQNKKKMITNMLLIKAVNEYIDMHFSDRITLSDVAEYCKISKFYFSHCFKDAANMSFISYLTLYRLKKAATLLKYSEKNVTDIAYSSGFSNVRSFNRMFKQHYNMTPSKYKETP